MSAPHQSPSVGDLVAPVTAGELERFGALQRRFAHSFGEIFDDPKVPRTVLIVPSLSLDQEVIAKISGVQPLRGADAVPPPRRVHNR